MTFTVLWENEHVRVLSYASEPGVPAEPSAHPNSVVIARGDAAAAATWLPAQQRATLDAGDAIVVELKGRQHEAPTEESDSAFAPSEAQLRAMFGDAIVDERVLLTPEAPDIGRWDAEVSYTSQLQRYKGWAAYASIGVNVLTGEWSFSCDVDDPATCVHTYALLIEALDDESFNELIEEGVAELG